MIPNEATELLSQPLTGHIGSRDATFATTENLIVGIKIHDDKKTATVYIPETVSSKQLSNFNDNKHVAVFFSHLFSHVAFQFKGSYLSSHTATDEENALIDTFVNRFYDDYLKLFGYPADIMDQFAIKPAIGITFQVNEIFTQTPGPVAGNKIA